ncbi:MAG: aminotransferase class V-fold PLP-dependent enzyme [Fibrobacter sp.]|uniref:aminotransferase class V-fold PLP-dependent enzyme n=1 Tax=Fibrobacter sp. TaxID=35828 RepID=UPI0025C14733|nr:aminotransferase class V-fold PLP-dependent enzyme [Fibrobacter sp.]MBQ9224760.1 aminotransferase class V-fold PLP-dependent enzyme [Fibrobacter sp.]
MAYFDNAATTFPKPECVYDFMNTFYRECGGNAGRGSHKFSIGAGKMVSETRNRLKQLLHCENKQIIFTSSATIALNMILQGFLDGKKTEGANVYISPFEHNAVTRILHHYEKIGKISVRLLAIKVNLTYDFEKIQTQFTKETPDLVVVSHASNVIGLISPVEKLCAMAKKYKAVTVIDMAQTAGLVDINVGLETIDFAVFAGHKTLYGPTGISGFAMKPDFDLKPVLFGGTGFESANQDMPKDIPQRYEMGTLNIAGIAGLYASLGWILENGVGTLWEKEQEHRKELLDILSSYDFIRILGVGEKNDYVGIVSCVIDGLPSDTAASVFAEKNIAVRSGLQCAPLAHKTLGTFPSGTVRFSCNAFTGDGDFVQLSQTLEFIKKNI